MKNASDSFSPKVYKLTPHLETDKLIKYHQAAQIYDPPLPITVCFYISEDKGLMPAYETFPEGKFKDNEQHYYNLLYLITLLINWDYRSMLFETYGDENPLISDEGTFVTDSATLQDDAFYHLNTLLSFLELASPTTKNLSLRINGEPEHKSSLKAKLDSQPLIQSFIDTTIRELFKQCKASNNEYLRFLIRDMDTPTIEGIRSIADVQNFIPPFKIGTTFRKLVVTTLRDYLNGETTFTKGENDALSKEQSLIIYALLAQTSFIPFETVKKHRTERQRIVFVRSLISSPLNNKLKSKKQGDIHEFPIFQKQTDKEVIEKILNENLINYF